MDRFLVYNGKVVEKDEPDLLHLFTGDSFKIARKIWYGYGGIPLFKENIDLLSNQVKMLNLQVPSFLEDKRELFRITKRMLNKNRLYRSGWVNFQLIGMEDEFQFLATCQPLETFDFPISKKGILLNYSNIIKYSTNTFNNFPLFNESIWWAAMAQNRDTLFQNTILLNEKESVCECVGTNLFLFIKNEMITPSLSTGGVEDTLRSVILKTAKNAGFLVKEVDDIKKENIQKVDELFIASEEIGIHWVLGVENKRFVHEHSITIYEEINKFLKEKIA